jgi:uncharacterized protein with von Willebrand factor type A (vWA) domain
MERALSLSKNIIQFCRFLRAKKCTVSVPEEISVLQGLSLFTFETSQDFFLLLKSILCKSYADSLAFEGLYNEFWKQKNRRDNSKDKSGNQLLKTSQSFKSLKSWLNKGVENKTEETATHSYHEALSEKDFSSISDTEVDELMQVIKALSKRLALRTARRYTRTHRMLKPDLRRTLRQNMRSGGELLKIYFKKHKATRTNIIILCDVSKSMDLYTSFFIQFMYSFRQVYRNLEVFTFGTSLQRITPVFRQHDFTGSLRLLVDHTDSWSSGTRIGECFNAFINEYASGLLTKRSIVIILSDGWETGDINLLKKTMHHLQKHSKRIIWLNPLAGYVSYSPDTSGMKAALPFVDVFASAHNAESLRKLGKWL